MEKKQTPVAVVAGLIILVAVLGIMSLFLNRYRPTKEKADLNSYYGLSAEDQAALIVDDQISEFQGIANNQEIYISYEAVYALFDTQFYWDASEQIMYLTTADGMKELTPQDKQEQTEKGEPVLILDEEENAYLAAQFVADAADIDCAIYEEPLRVVFRTKWQGLQCVQAVSDTEVRIRGGIKSPVLQTIKKGQTLTFLEALDNWTKVSTDQGMIGYVENKDISEKKDAPVRAQDQSRQLSRIKKDYAICLGWHQVSNSNGIESLPARIADTKGMNVISPTWFRLEDQEGTIRSFATKEYVDLAHANGIEVWGLLDNFQEDVSTEEVLSSRQKRAYIVAQMIDYASFCGMDGINVDFEQMSERTIPHFLQFLRELTIRAHEKNLVITVDNPVPQNYNMYYKRGTQGKIADYLIIMGYDEHYSGSEEAGSVASLPFVEAGIRTTLEEVPAERVINAVPFYTRLWKETFGQSLPSSEVLGMDGAQKYIQEHQMTAEWDASLGQYVAISEDDTARYTIWLEDTESLEEKMKLIQNYGLAGVAAWRLGLEQDGVWDIIQKYLG